MQKTVDNPVGRIILRAMRRNGMADQRDLAKVVYFNYYCLNARMNGRTSWKLEEIQELDKLLNFTDSEAIQLIKGTQKAKNRI